MFSVGLPLEKLPRELGVKRCQPFWLPADRESRGGVKLRFELLNVRFGPFDPRFPLLVPPPSCPERDSKVRTALPELGGVNACHPGRDDVIGARARLVKPFVRVFVPEEGRANEREPESKPAAARALELTPARAATLAWPVFARFAVKKCCVDDGACR